MKKFTCWLCARKFNSEENYPVCPKCGACCDASDDTERKC